MSKETKIMLTVIILQTAFIMGGTFAAIKQQVKPVVQVYTRTVEVMVTPTLTPTPTSRFLDIRNLKLATPTATAK